MRRSRKTSFELRSLAEPVAEPGFAELGFKRQATGLARRFSLAERSKDAERVDESMRNQNAERPVRLSKLLQPSQAYDSGRRAKKTLESQSPTTQRDSGW